MIVLDASALLALIAEEPGASAVQDALPSSLMSTVNLAETLARVVDFGGDVSGLASQVQELGVVIIDFDVRQAEEAARLRAATRSHGLSLGDRACLALAVTRASPVLTADRAWAELDLGVEIRLIR